MPLTRFRRFLSFAVGSAVLVLLTGAAAEAAAPGAWTRLTAKNGHNYDEVHAVAGASGVLHVVWARVTPGNPNAEDVMYTRLAGGGATIGSPVVVQSAWGTMNNPAIAARADGTLLAFFAGVHSTSTSDPYSNGRVTTAAAPATGASWTLNPPGTLVNAAYASTEVSATIAGDGTPLSTYSATGSLGLITGVPSDAGATWTNLETGCCSYSTNLATDAASGQVVVGWYSNVTGRYGQWMRAVHPALGTSELLPGSAVGGNAASLSQRLPLAARSSGKPGVYAAYCMGYPTCTGVAVHRYGSGTSRTVIARGNMRSPAIATGPDGRLWVFWVRRSALYFTRSNPSATRWGSITSIPLPRRTRSVWRVSGAGSGEKLNLFAHVSTPGSLATWQTRIFARLTVRPTFVMAGGSWVLLVKVTDAGANLASVHVSALGRSATTNTQGIATIPVPRPRAGAYAVFATRPGYARTRATATFR